MDRLPICWMARSKKTAATAPWLPETCCIAGAFLLCRSARCRASRRAASRTPRAAPCSSLLRQARRHRGAARLAKRKAPHEAGRSYRVTSSIRNGLAGSELGRQVTVDLKADTDFDKRRSGPGHDCSSLFVMRLKLAVRPARRKPSSRSPAS
jgi:hypothetical protein